MTARGLQLTRQKSPIGSATWLRVVGGLIVAVCIAVVLVRSFPAHAGDLLDLLFWQVGEVGWVGVGHCGCG